MRSNRKRLAGIVMAAIVFAVPAGMSNLGMQTSAEHQVTMADSFGEEYLGHEPEPGEDPRECFRQYTQKCNDRRAEHDRLDRSDEED